jgi:hypothetical protein
VATRKKTAATEKAKPKAKAKAKPKVEAPPPPEKTRDLIQVWLVALKREHYDDVPLDWPEQLISPIPTVVLRPRPKQQQVLPRPVSVEVLGPESQMPELRSRLGSKFQVTVVSDGT